MLFDYDLLMNLSSIDNNNLVDKGTGLQRGNLFSNEYKPYKNYNPSKIHSNNELLLKLYELNFAIIDLNIYLDLNPNDSKMYNIYKSYVKDYEDVKNMYENKFGPLEITCVDNDTYDWINNPWPWDGGNKYV